MFLWRGRDDYFVNIHKFVTSSTCCKGTKSNSGHDDISFYMELTQATWFKEKSIVYVSATLAAVAQKKVKVRPFQNDNSYSLSCENATIIRKPNIRLNLRMHISVVCLPNIRRPSWCRTHCGVFERHPHKELQQTSLLPYNYRFSSRHIHSAT